MHALRFATYSLVLALCAFPAAARELAPASAQTEVGFSPSGSAHELIIRAIQGARQSIRVAAYSFTSKDIARALVEAHREGVDVRVVLDDSQKSERYTGATFLANAGIPTRTSSRYAIMHNKFLVIDDKHVQTGSFNYTKGAQQRNAENVIVLWNQPAIAVTYDREWQRLWQEADDYQKRY
jgi:phosphatidylserine/phosphatidylglycerophosphate/cardiolipin synthase-like enzyme